MKLALKTVLIGWELGAGRGHIERLVPIVSSYRSKGWFVVTALRDARLGEEILGPHQTKELGGRLEIIRAPIFSHIAALDGSVHSLAEILARSGFSNRDLVAPLMKAWDKILSRYQPDLVISDCAPSLNVVARNRVPLTVIGNGWTIPPDRDPLPALITSSTSDSAIREASRAVLSAMNYSVSGAQQIDRFSDLLRGDRNMVCTLAETDPYRESREELLYWPFEVAAPAGPLSTARSGGVIYLPSSHPARPLVELAAGHASMQFDAFFNGVPLHPSSNVLVHKLSIDFSRIIPTKRIVIHHGGLGTAIWCIVHRVPQLIFPADLEKLLIARGISADGWGNAIQPGIRDLDLQAAIEITMSLELPTFDALRMATLSQRASVDALQYGAS